MLCYVHLPKTAGKSLARYTRKTLGRRGALGALLEEELRGLSDRALSEAGILVAHLAYDDLQRIRQLCERPPLLATIVREPRERFLSHFFFIKRVRIHAWHRRFCDLSLDQALEDPELVAELDNYQYRYLLRALLPPDRQSIEHLPEVWSALSVVGDAACLPASALLTLYRGGIPPVASLRLFKRPIGAVRRGPISAKALATIDSQINGYDRPLYAEGRRRFRADFAAMAHELGLAGLDPELATIAELEACRVAAVARLRDCQQPARGNARARRC